MKSVDWHRRAFQTYRLLPRALQRVTRTVYETYFEGSQIAPNYRRGFIKEFFDDEGEFEFYVREFQSLDVVDEIEQAHAEHRRRTDHGRFAAINQFTLPRIYALVRKCVPDTVIETGVCNGVSTYIVLQALEQNGHGQLHSIDYPDPERIPEGKEPGWIIPNDLRHRWSLTKGMSREVLPNVVADVNGIDFFLHDTIASIFAEELNIVWPKLSPEAVIIADDVHNSNDFANAIESNDVDSGFVAPNVGYLIKK